MPGNDPAARPLSTRSVVLSTLLGTEPPELPARSLVRVGEAFGLSESSVRTALSRMVARGELSTRDGRYRLEARHGARQRRQQSGLTGETRAWKGRWAVAIVEADRRPAAARSELRQAMHNARFGELREGVWLRPDNLPEPRPAEGERQCTWMAAEPADHQALASRLWPLTAMANEGRDLVAAIDKADHVLASTGADALASTFVVAASALRWFARDPLLPGDLHPERWPGRDLRTAYRRFDITFRAVLRTWILEPGK